MLRIIHNKKIAKMIGFGMLLLIGPAFIFWGIGADNPAEKGENFGKVFGRRIKRQEYVNALKASQLQMRMQFGEAYNELQKYVDFRSVAMQRLALLEEAKRKKIRVSDKEVISQVTADPSFFRNGSFDKSLYELAVKNYLRMTPRDFEEQTRQNILIRKLSESVVVETPVSDDEVRQAFRKANEQLDLDYLGAIPADFAASLSPEDRELREYYDARSIEFKRPMSYDLEYVMTDKEHQVTAINSRLEKETLDKVAADMQLELKSTGLFTEEDPIPGIGWSRELSNSLSGAQAGQVFPPLEMDKKYYILRLKERKEPYVPEFESVREQVKAAVVKETSRRLAKEKIESSLPRITENAGQAKPVAWDKIAGQLGLKNGNTGLFKSGSYLEGVGTSDDFYSAARDSEIGKPSGVIEMPSGFYVVMLKARQGVEEEKFDAEKEKLRKQLADQKKQEAFGKYVNDLMLKAYK